MLSVTYLPPPPEWTHNASSYILTLTPKTWWLDHRLPTYPHTTVTLPLQKLFPVLDPRLPTYPHTTVTLQLHKLFPVLKNDVVLSCCHHFISQDVNPFPALGVWDSPRTWTRSFEVKHKNVRHAWCVWGLIPCGISVSIISGSTIFLLGTVPCKWCQS